MYSAIIILIILAAVVLTLIVLVQNSKGGGLAAGFQSSNQYMGVRKTTDFLEKLTWGLAIFIVVLSIVAVGVHSKGNKVETGSEISQESLDINKGIKEGTAIPNFGEVPEPTTPNTEPATEK